MFLNGGIEMRYEDLQRILGDRFPQLLPHISHYFDTYGCDFSEPYILYNEVLNPYVKKLLREGNDNESLRDVFEFYEELAQSDDEEVRNLLQVELLEVLWAEKALFTKACSQMLPETKKINENIKTRHNVK